MNLPAFPNIDLSCAGINALNRMLVASIVKDPAYLLVCLATGFLGLAIYRYADSKTERFRTRALAFSRLSRRRGFSFPEPTRNRAQPWSIGADRQPTDCHEHGQHVR